MKFQTALSQLVSGEDLPREVMREVMMTVMTGEASPAQIGAMLVALRMKGESIDEITGAAEVMRELVTPVEVHDDHLVDLVGTGGDGANLFNVSTAATFVAAAAGARVAKHGNRSVSSSSGSSDVLETLGVSLDLTPAQIAQCIEGVGLGFMFAPAHHGAMKHAIGPRRELGLRTIFNIPGPMTNPAGVKHQLIGVYDKTLCRPMAEVLGRLGAKHIMVVHSADGLDEISIAAETYVAEFKSGTLTEYSIAPEDFFSSRQSLQGLSVTDAQQSLEIIMDALGKQRGSNAAKAADLIAINAGAALYVAGCASTLNQGIEMAQDSIQSGLALAKVKDFAAFTKAQADA